MRILWFTNTASLATEPLTGQVGVGGGWIESLELKMHEKGGLDVAVAFPWIEPELKTFHFGEGTYYGIPSRSTSKYERLVERHTAKLEDPQKQVEYYLQVIEDFKPDVIHIFGSERAYGLLIPHIQVPTLIWIQGNLTVYSLKWYTDLTREDVDKYTPVSSKVKGTSWHHKYREALNIAAREQEIFSHCQYFTGRTPWDRRLTMTLAPQAKYFHCDEVMRPQFYGPQWEPHHEREKLVIMTTIRGNIFKGLRSIYDTSVILKRLMDTPFEWRLAGIAPENELVTMVEQKLGMNHKELNLNLMGNKTPDELVEELLHADIFMHPSFIDNSPNSVCEAMLVGTPVVSSNVGGIPGLLVEGEEGLLVQPGDPYAMAGAILDIHRNPDWAARMSENARKRGAVRNDPDRILEELLGVYRNVVAQHAPVV
ncbi:MAG: glycosyltransferase [Bacteroidota bacterium]